MANVQIAQAYVTPTIEKASMGLTQAKNHRELHLDGKMLRWDTSLNRDQLMGSMKAFEVVTTDMLNPSWASQTVSLPEGTAITLIANRVKGMRENAQVWKLEIDTKRGVITSAEIAPGSAW